VVFCPRFHSQRDCVKVESEMRRVLTRETVAIGTDQVL
jgi:hypothetical protein